MKNYFFSCLSNHKSQFIFSACGKTNLAMLRPTGLPGYKIECVGK